MGRTPGSNKPQTSNVFVKFPPTFQLLNRLLIFSPAAVSKVRTLRTSLARDPFPGPSSTSCSCLG